MAFYDVGRLKQWEWEKSIFRIKAPHRYTYAHASCAINKSEGSEMEPSTPSSPTRKASTENKVLQTMKVNQYQMETLSWITCNRKVSRNNLEGENTENNFGILGIFFRWLPFKLYFWHSNPVCTQTCDDRLKHEIVWLRLSHYFRNVSKQSFYKKLNYITPGKIHYTSYVEQMENNLWRNLFTWVFFPLN